jgi:hypothetical protein
MTISHRPTKFLSPVRSRLCGTKTLHADRNTSPLDSDHDGLMVGHLQTQSIPKARNERTLPGGTEHEV